MTHDEDDDSRGGDGGAIDPRLVEALAEIAVRQGLAEIEIRQKGLRIQVSRQIAAPAASASVAAAPVVPTPALAPTGAQSPEAAAVEQAGAVRSPMVGTIYLRAEPGAPPFIEVGSVVAQGDRLMLVEAMKTFNDIVAPRGGTVTAILVGDGDPVEYGEPLLIIE